MSFLSLAKFHKSFFPPNQLRHKIVSLKGSQRRIIYYWIKAQESSSVLPHVKTRNTLKLLKFREKWVNTFTGREGEYIHCIEQN